MANHFLLETYFQGLLQTRPAFHTQDPSSLTSAIWNERPSTRCLRMTKSKPFAARLSQDAETTIRNTDEKIAVCN